MTPNEGDADHEGGRPGASAGMHTGLECLVTMDASGVVVDFDPAAERTFRYSRNDAIGKPLADLIVPPLLRQAHRAGLARYLATGEGPVIGRQMKLVAMRADGTEFPVALLISRADSGGRPIFTGRIRDLTVQSYFSDDATVALPAPMLRPDQKAALIDYWRFYEPLAAILQQELIEACLEMPEWGPIIRAMTPEQNAVQNQRSLDLQRRAIVEEDWQPYLADLHAQGTMYALGGTTFAAWFEIITAFRDALRQHLREAARIDSDLASSVTDGMNCLLDVAMAHIGEAYLATKERLIRERDETLRSIANRREAEESERRLMLERLARADAERSEAAAQEESRRLRILADASKAFAAAVRTPDAILTQAARYCAELIGDGCVIQQLAEDTPELHVVAFYNREPEYGQMAAQSFLGKRTARGGVSARVLDTGAPALIPVIEPKDASLLAAPMFQEFLERFPVYSVIAVPLLVSGNPTGVVALSRHSPGRPYTEDDLALLQDLAGRAGLAMTNAELYRELEASLEARDNFLAIAGHELKTPLAALLIHVQGIQRIIQKTPDSTLGERINKVAKTGLRLERLIKQLLDVSRITSGKLTLEPESINLSTLVREVAARIEEARGESKGSIMVNCEEQVKGWWDPFRVEQIVDNILGNAVKYGEGKPVEVELCSDDRNAILRVTDHGIGIELDRQKKLFQKFERAVTGRGVGGFGLGLWIARMIAETCGGTIQVQSVPGRGSTFTVRLPLGQDRSTSEVCHGVA